MNSNRPHPDNKGLVVVLFVLLNSIALRETYTGNPEWNLVHAVTLPLLLYYFYRMHARTKKKKQPVKKQYYYRWSSKSTGAE